MRQRKKEKEEKFKLLRLGFVVLLPFFYGKA